MYSCSTVTFSQFPQPPINLYNKSNTLEGISTVAQPLLNDLESKEYFGVPLLENNILAVYISIINNSDRNLLLSYETINIDGFYLERDQINQQNAMDSGGGLAVAGAVIGAVPLIMLGEKQVRDSILIDHNFKSKMLRSTTIDSGETVSGFCYFNWNILKDSSDAKVCLKLLDTVANEDFPLCLNATLRN